MTTPTPPPMDDARIDAIEAHYSGPYTDPCAEARYGKEVALELIAEVRRLRGLLQHNKREIFRHTIRMNYLAESIKDGFHTPEEWLQKSEEHARGVMP